MVKLVLQGEQSAYAYYDIIRNLLADPFLLPSVSSLQEIEPTLEFNALETLGCDACNSCGACIACSACGVSGVYATYATGALIATAAK